MEWLEPVPGVSQASPLLRDHHFPALIRVRTRAQGAGAEALGVGSYLVSLPVRVYLLSKGTPRPSGGQRQKGLQQSPGVAWGTCWDCPTRLVRAPGSLQHAASSCSLETVAMVPLRSTVMCKLALLPPCVRSSPGKGTFAPVERSSSPRERGAGAGPQCALGCTLL